LRFPAVPNAMPSPTTRGVGADRPPSNGARRPAALFLLAVTAVALCVVGAASIAAVALVSKARIERSTKVTVVEPRTAPTPTPEEKEPPPSAPEALPPAPPPQPSPARDTLAASRSDAPERAPAQWPPARAFTARCRAPAGGCVPECTELAGGRCLDPCFIHTPECSKDCLRPDGTCGFPPPDTE
jgi:hypothetical protein